MKLTQTAITLLRNNKKLMGRVMGHVNRHQRTIEFMIESNDSRLIADEVVQIIREETGLMPEQILEEVVEVGGQS